MKRRTSFICSSIVTSVFVHGNAVDWGQRKIELQFRAITKVNYLYFRNENLLHRIGEPQMVI